MCCPTTLKLVGFRVERSIFLFGVPANVCYLHNKWKGTASLIHLRDIAAPTRMRSSACGTSDGPHDMDLCPLEHLERIVPFQYCCSILRMFLGWFQVT